MAIIGSESLLSTLIDIKEKVQLLEQEFKVQSLFVSVGNEGTSYAYASSKCNNLVNGDSELGRLFVRCIEKQIITPEDPITLELECVMTLLDEYGSTVKSNPSSDVKPCLDLIVSSEDFNEVMAEMDAKDIHDPVGNDAQGSKEGEPRRIADDDDDHCLSYIESSDWMDDRPYDSIVDSEKLGFPCPHCPVLLSNKHELKLHILDTHSNFRPHACNICSSRFEDGLQLDRHRKVHLCKLLYQCTVCGAGFDRMPSLKDHECLAEQKAGTSAGTKEAARRTKTAPSGKPIFCRWCGNTFGTDSERRRHMASHLKAGLKCQKCDAKFKSWRILRDHLALIHADPLPFHCCLCDASFKTALSMGLHVEELHRNDSSDFAFTRFRRFSPREKSKHSSASHLCPFCGRCFESKKEMGRHHSQVHRQNKRKRTKNLTQKKGSESPSQVVLPEMASGSSCLKCIHCEISFDGEEDLKSHLEDGTCFILKGLEDGEPRKEMDQNDDDVRQALLSQRRRSRKNPVSRSPELCHVCGKEFSGGYYLCQHLLSHGETRPFQCRHCDKTFKRRSTLDEHLELHSESKRFQCQTCQRKFHFASVLRQHRKVHSADRVYGCDACLKNFKHLSSFKKHRCLVAKEPPEIPLSDLSKHSQKDESLPPIELSPEEKPKKLLELSDPTRQFACQVCLKRFRARKELEKHRRVHSDARPYSCPICPKTFKHPSSLKQHQSVHSGERPYACTCCPKRFKNASALREHTDKNRYKCSRCGKQYMQRRTLLTHMATCSRTTSVSSGKRETEDTEIPEEVAPDQEGRPDPGRPSGEGDDGRFPPQESDNADTHVQLFASTDTIQVLDASSQLQWFVSPNNSAYIPLQEHLQQLLQQSFIL